MNHGSLIFVGVFLSFVLSWGGMVFAPQSQLARQDVAVDEATGNAYPPARSGLAAQGREVYRELGCAACHTQQVRDSDVPRWGQRYTTATDYLRDNPPLLGFQRVGPDLTTIGQRQPDTKWQYEHLYRPTLKVAKSPMPEYKFLFKKQKQVVPGENSPLALKLEGADAPEKGFEIVPTEKAEQLVAYLNSLRLENFLFESPNPHPPKQTNAPVEPEAVAATPAK